MRSVIATTMNIKLNQNEMKMKRIMMKIVKEQGAFLLGLFLIVMAIPFVGLRIIVAEAKDVLVALDYVFDELERGLKDVCK